MLASNYNVISIFIISLFIPCFSFAEEQMDVDLADSPFFSDFHKDKKQALKVWTQKDGLELQKDIKTEKAYNTNTTNNTAPAPADAGDKSGKRYEIRELYSISGSDRTGYTPSTVVQALYLQMQGLCPDGWKKLDERSQPDGKDAFYMYYSFECL